MADEDDVRRAVMVKELVALFTLRAEVERRLTAQSYQNAEPGDPKRHETYHVDMYYTARLVKELNPARWDENPIEALESTLKKVIDDKLTEEHPHAAVKVTYKKAARGMFILNGTLPQAPRWRLLRYLPS